MNEASNFTKECFKFEQMCSKNLNSIVLNFISCLYGKGREK